MRRRSPPRRRPGARRPLPSGSGALLLLLPILALAPGRSVPSVPAASPVPGPPSAASPVPGSTADRSADTLRVLVYNLHAGKDAGGAGNLERVADVIREAGADLVLLQEVDRGTRRSGGVDQLAVLERRTGLRGAFGKTLDYQGGGYGLAVLSRWPIARDTLLRLPVEPVQERAGGSHEPRGALRVRVEAPSGALEVVNTHLDASAEDVYRRQEVATVLRVAERLRDGGARVLVGGDLNAEAGSPTVRRLTDAGWVDAWRACGEGDGRTYPAAQPTKRIDYLFLAPGGTCSDAAVLSTAASDHRPLRVSVTTGAAAR